MANAKSYETDDDKEIANKVEDDENSIYKNSTGRNDHEDRPS